MAKTAKKASKRTASRAAQRTAYGLSPGGAWSVREQALSFALQMSRPNVTASQLVAAAREIEDFLSGAMAKTGKGGVSK